MPVTDTKSGERLSGRALTHAVNKRAALGHLYRDDQRVAPWAGTAMGVVKAVNTYEHHESTVRGATRPERNMLRTITGDFGAVDRATWTSLQRVIA